MNPAFADDSVTTAEPLANSPTPSAALSPSHTPGRWAGVTDLLSTLIRIDTQIGGPGERVAAEHLATLLSDAGLHPTLLESEPGRANLFVRVPGTDLGLDPLLVQMHLDVVPARADEWSVHPLSGEVRDGYVWGRGAVDMKNMVATVVTIVLDRLSTGRLPKRPLMLAFFADEENAGPLGAEWAVREHPELFEGVRTAIGEGGGWSVPLPSGERLYPVHVAEKGWAAMEVTVTGQPAHASRVLNDNPVRVLAEAIGRLLRSGPGRGLAAGVRGARHGGRQCGREPAAHGPPHPHRGRLPEQRHPRSGLGRARLPIPAGALGGVPR